MLHRCLNHETHSSCCQSLTNGINKAYQASTNTESTLPIYQTAESRFNDFQNEMRKSCDLEKDCGIEEAYITENWFIECAMDFITHGMKPDPQTL